MKGCDYDRTGVPPPPPTLRRDGLSEKEIPYHPHAAAR